MFKRQNDNPYSALKVGQYTGDDGLVKSKISSVYDIENNENEIKWSMKPPRWVKNITAKTENPCDIVYDKNSKSLAIHYIKTWKFNDQTITLEEAIDVLLDKDMTPGSWSSGSNQWWSNNSAWSTESDSKWINKRGQDNNHSYKNYTKGANNYKKY